MLIYTVTTLTGKVEYPSRCVGYFPGTILARMSIENNDCDIYECGHYPYAVIEEFEPGIYVHPRVIQWYKWKDDKYVKIDEVPEVYEKVCNFGIG